jgi:hypothetical protein
VRSFFLRYMLLQSAPETVSRDDSGDSNSRGSGAVVIDKRHTSTCETSRFSSGKVHVLLPTFFPSRLLL